MSSCSGLFQTNNEAEDTCLLFNDLKWTDLVRQATKLGTGKPSVTLQNQLLQRVTFTIS